MDELKNKQKTLQASLEELKQIRSRAQTQMNTINDEIKGKVELHNQLVASITNMKKEYKEKIRKFEILKSLVKEYKKDQHAYLEEEYKKQIERAMGEINALKFEVKLSVFKSFDTLKAIQTAEFPFLDAKKTEFQSSCRAALKKRILREIVAKMQESGAIADLIFHINFIIKYEAYFEEDAFFPFLVSKLEKEFEYHFLSDRETNRLDKPEWFFNFLVKKYEESENVIQIYSDCRKRHGLADKSIVELILQTGHLPLQKLNEISNSQSDQRRNLILNFVEKYKTYALAIKSAHSFEPRLDEIGHALASAQEKYIKNEFARICDLRYIQWFPEYKKLCRDALLYTYKYGEIDKHFRFKEMIVRILSHSKLFIEHFRFINREEIRVILHIFSEFEDLKTFISEEERAISQSNPSSASKASLSSIDKITAFNAELFKLIRNLASNDIENSLKKIAYFAYSSNEQRRTVIAEIYKIFEEYRPCVYSDLIEKRMQETADQFLLDEILLKVRFSSDDYLEFRNFFRSLKKAFSAAAWKSEDACRSIDAIFEDRTEAGELFKIIKKLYER